MKKIAVLTSGGDAPGMNAAIRAVVISALKNNIKVVGIEHGYSGLLNEKFIDLDFLSVNQIANLGGTMLFTSRSPEFETDEGLEKAAKICKQYKIDAIVSIGGDGSIRGARDLSLKGIPFVCIPATIDNDISYSQYSIGFDTAINTVTNIVGQISNTVVSHDRCFIIEVMGRACGDIALNAGIACGATAVIIPEIEFDIDSLVEKVKESRKMGKSNQIIIVSEGVTSTKDNKSMSVFDMAKIIEDQAGINCRADVLGFVQRGGVPTTKERVVASEMGTHAVNLLKENVGNRVVVKENGKITDIDLIEAHSCRKKYNKKLYEIVDILAL